MVSDNKPEWLVELEKVCSSGYLHDTGGLEAVARHVLANADYYRRVLGMEAVAEVTRQGFSWHLGGNVQCDYVESDVTGHQLPAVADTRPVTAEESAELRAHVEQPRYMPTRPLRRIVDTRATYAPERSALEQRLAVGEGEE